MPMEVLDYYRDSYPCQLIYKWLNYKDGGKDCFKFREFSFTLQGDIYVRYQTFNDAEDFWKTLNQKVPLKIDAGAVYNISPKLAKACPNNFQPQQHELVFDIDISDYDDVRNCCKESNICRKCWPFMKIGAKVLRAILTRDFGFKHLLFVFSGRRGFHCWVCDKVARELNSDARKAIADYFSVVTGGQSMVKRVSLNSSNGMHPMISKALEVIEEDFDDLMINKQDFLADAELIQNVIDLCEDQNLQTMLKATCKQSHLTSAECWDVIKKVHDKYKSKRRSYYIQEVKLQHCFPRLDANVTRGFNHLLKLPFCIHPKTGNVCVPIDIDNIDSFDIFGVPNLKTMTNESLVPYLKVMKKFVDSLDTN